jgi:hypothetical protein
MPDRFAEVVKGQLYRGGAPTPADLQMLKNLFGIKKVVSLDDEIGHAIHNDVKALGMKHVIIPLTTGFDPRVRWLKSALPKLLKDGPVYIHCKHGKDRTGMAVAMFKVLNGTNVTDALAEAQGFGMGEGLSDDVHDSYYEAVINFAKQIQNDISDASDVVEMTRENNNMSLNEPGPRNSFMPGTDPENNRLNRVASNNKIYCKCNIDDVSKSKTIWFFDKEKAIEHGNSSGKLYSANLNPEYKIVELDTIPNKEQINNILTKDIAAAIFQKTTILVVYYKVLDNLKEEGDNNYVFDVGSTGPTQIDSVNNNVPTSGGFAGMDAQFTYMGTPIGGEEGVSMDNEMFPINIDRAIPASYIPNSTGL